MKNIVFAITVIFFFMASFLIYPNNLKADNTEQLLQQIKILQQKLTELEQKVKEQEKELKNIKTKKENVKEETAKSSELTHVIKTELENISLNIGSSAGYFYANHSGKDTQNDKFILSNFLITLDYAPKDAPVSFSAAYGGTATPSLFDAPQDADSQPTFDIEYADFTISPVKWFDFEIGLLTPNAGYEDTYTYNNKNITVGAIASQQPYNAYGTRGTIKFNDLINVYAGFYENRKDKDEYAIELPSGKTRRADNSWEAGITGNIFDTDYTVYYYNLNNMKKLAGIVLEKTICNFYFALNVDYWNWNKKWHNYYGDKSSIGGAFYVSPTFGKFEFPLRLEYINQGKSKIYTDSTDAKDIYAITFTPTYHFSDNTYFRIEGSYINADKSFTDDNGNLKDSRYYLSCEVGLKF